MEITNIALPRREIAEFCQRHHIRKLLLFGSVLRGDFRPESDIDLIGDFEAGYEPTLADLLTIEAELKAIFQRDVDFGDRESVEEDPNYLRRRRILNSAQVIYEG